MIASKHLMRILQEKNQQQQPYAHTHTHLIKTIHMMCDKNINGNHLETVVLRDVQ